MAFTRSNYDRPPTLWLSANGLPLDSRLPNLRHQSSSQRVERRGLSRAGQEIVNRDAKGDAS
jgi:hypothetical protein